jgi:hypothetical protein
MSTTVKPLTERQALAAFHSIVRALDTKLGYEGQLIEATKDATPTRQGLNDPQWYRGPVLCRNFEGWSTTTDWAVVWEDGEYEWVYLSLQKSVSGEVFVEPVNGFALGLYRP